MLQNWIQEFGHQRNLALSKGASSRRDPVWIANAMLESWATIALLDTIARKPTKRADQLLADITSAVEA
ncbi:hypothetical protein ASC89_04290 [Devosia sp. Root413D1]|nr:hypothetical protein ASC89_04290 [Devosia sp. Root413D1]